jgi:hypothetical protein
MVSDLAFLPPANNHAQCTNNFDVDELVTIAADGMVIIQ